MFGAAGGEHVELATERLREVARLYRTVGCPEHCCGPSSAKVAITACPPQVTNVESGAI